jgi:hypothetical protein
MIEYTRIITDEEQKILENDLIDIKDWIDKAIEGKINNCFKRAAIAYDELAKKENIELVPVKSDLKVKELFKHVKYKNRQQREIENGQVK